MDMSMLTGEGVGINVYGHDLDQVQEVAIDLAGKLEGIEGTTDVSDGNDVPAMEIRITVDKDAAIAKGLTVYQVYNAVSQLLSTKSATTSIDASGVSMDVMVNDSDYAAPTLEDLYALTIDSPQLGEAVPIGDVASIEMVRGYSSISHENQKRYVTVSAQIADGYNVGKVGKQVERMVDDYQVPEGITLEVTGENESINDAMHDLELTLILAIILVYLVMVAQFQNLKYPFIIMFTLPLSYTGGVLLLAILGMDLSIVSVVGFVMLTGIVVNNGIVFVDYVNQRRADGMRKREALLTAGRHRIRPIVMTALTTIVAMLIMAMGVGESAELAQPMAVVIIGGLVYATALTTIIVPIIYDLFTKGDSEGESFEPLPDSELPASAHYGVARLDAADAPALLPE